MTGVEWKVNKRLWAVIYTSSGSPKVLIPTIATTGLKAWERFMEISPVEDPEEATETFGAQVSPISVATNWDEVAALKISLVEALNQLEHWLEAGDRLPHEGDVPQLLVDTDALLEKTRIEHGL